MEIILCVNLNFSVNSVTARLSVFFSNANMRLECNSY